MSIKTSQPAASPGPGTERIASAALRRAVEPLEFPTLEWPATAPGDLPPVAPAGRVVMPTVSVVGLSELPAADARLRPAQGREWPSLPSTRPGQRPDPAVLAMRRPPTPFDRQLTRLGTRWLLSIPRRHRPRELAAGFPHVVNRLALLWGKRDLVDLLFDDLLVDRRGGRQGFPRAVTDELLVLHEHFLGLFDRTARPLPLSRPSGGDTQDAEPTVPMPLEWTVG